MTYQVMLHESALRFLKSLPTQIAEHIKTKLQRVGEDPFQYLEHYEGAVFYKLRIGEYRALIDADVMRKILFVRVLDKRSRIYKR